MTEHEWLASADTAAMLTLRRTDCCGCLWADNGDGTVSLCAGQRPCGQCDNGPILPYTPFSDRKLRLFACACWRLHNCRRSRPEHQFWEALDLAEKIADGDASLNPVGGQTYTVLSDSALDAARAAAEHSSDCDGVGLAGREIAALLRDIIGNPFRPVTLPKEYTTVEAVSSVVFKPQRDAGHCPWLTPTVVALAESAYRERACPSCQGTGVCRRSNPVRRHRLKDGPCPRCQGSREIGTLDPDLLAVLSDALLEVGCDSEDIIVHLRSPGPHVRGCWVIDLLTGRC